MLVSRATCYKRLPGVEGSWINDPTSESPEVLPAEAAAPAATITQSPELREEALDRALQRQVAQGWRIEGRSAFQAVIAKGNRLNNTRHLILTIITVGLWGIVWLVLAIFGGIKRRVIIADEYGNIVDDKLE